MKKHFTKEEKRLNYNNELKKSHTRRHIERIRSSLKNLLVRSVNNEIHR